MNMQDVSSLEIPEGNVREIRDNNGALLWSKEEYSVNYRGNSTQDTYSGKNLLPYPYDSHHSWNGITFIANPDGTIVLNGKNSGGGNSSRHFFYTSDSPITFSAGTYYFIPPDSTSVGFVFHKTGGGYVEFDSSNGYSATFSSDTSVDQIYIQVKKNNTTTFDSFVVYPMLSKLSGQTKDDYEKYDGMVQSPTPEAPQNIYVVAGQQSVLVSGKNMFDQNNVIQQSYFEKDDLEPVIMSGGNNNITVYSMCEPDSSYSFRMPVASSNPPLGIIAVSWSETLPNIGTKVYSTKRIRGSSYETTFNGYETGASAKYLVFRFQGSHFMDTGGGWELLKREFQIEKGSTATSYEKPNLKQYSVDLGSIELCKIGTYQDYIYKSGDDWYIHKEVDSYTFTGEESTWSSGNTGRFHIPFGDNSPFNKVAKGTPSYQSFCTHFTFQRDGTAWTGDSKCGFNSVGTFWVMDADFSSLTNFKTWLSSNSVKCYFPLDSTYFSNTKITSPTLISQLDDIYKFLTRYSYDSVVSGNLPIVISRTNL